jgi:RNA polymerase sigma-70 factor (ECF subfamily)
MGAPPLENEAGLVRRARSGNEDAFAELVRRNCGQIYRVSVRILKNHEDAEDNVQNVLYKAYDHLDRFEGQSRFSTWLVRITINEALMKLRKMRSERSHEHTSTASDGGKHLAPREVRDLQPDPERACISKELANRAFDGLRPALRETFLLHKEAGWTNRELADALGVTVETVKSRIFRARVRMRHTLQPANLPAGVPLEHCDLGSA